MVGTIMPVQIFEFSRFGSQVKKKPATFYAGSNKLFILIIAFREQWIQYSC